MKPAIRTAVIPAAGLGTRMLPATKAVPKELLPIVDKPVIQYVVEEAVRSGIEHVVIVTSQSKRAIEDHFDYNEPLENRLMADGKLALLRASRGIADMASFTFVRQHEPLGNGHAILCARRAVGNEPFAMLWGDYLVLDQVPCARQLIDAFDQLGTSVCAVTKVDKSEANRYGIVEGARISSELLQVRRIVEKPEPEAAPSNLAAVCGAVFTPELFDVLATTPAGQSGEIWLTDAMNILAAGRRLCAVEVNGRHYDAGDPLGLLKATIDIALSREEIRPEFAQYFRAATAELARA